MPTWNPILACTSLDLLHKCVFLYAPIYVDPVCPYVSLFSIPHMHHTPHSLCPYDPIEYSPIHLLTLSHVKCRSIPYMFLSSIPSYTPIQYAPYMPYTVHPHTLLSSKAHVRLIFLPFLVCIPICSYHVHLHMPLHLFVLNVYVPICHIQHVPGSFALLVCTLVHHHKLQIGCGSLPRSTRLQPGIQQSRSNLHKFLIFPSTL